MHEDCADNYNSERFLLRYSKKNKSNCEINENYNFLYEIVTPVLNMKMKNFDSQTTQ